MCSNATLGIRLNALSESQSALTFGVLLLTALAAVQRNNSLDGLPPRMASCSDARLHHLHLHNQSYRRSVVRYDWIVWGLMAAPLLECDESESPGPFAQFRRCRRKVLDRLRLYSAAGFRQAVRLGTGVLNAPLSVRNARDQVAGTLVTR